MLQTPCFTCVDGVYVGIYGHLNIIFTQDDAQAAEIAYKMGSSQTPYWWTEETPITPENLVVISQTIQEMERLLGNMGLCEFASVRERKTAQGSILVFALHGFVF